MPLDISEYSNDISGTEISYIKNFISKESCELLIEAIEDALANRSYPPELYEYVNDRYETSKSSPYIYLFHYPDDRVKDIVKDFSDRSVAVYEEIYGKSDNITYIKLGTINTMRAGTGMTVHSDDGPSLNNNVATPHGMVLYINDDYEGGEIHYPGLKIAIKPEAGSLVIHPGSAAYAHGVAPVTAGNRYASTAFVKKKLP